MKRSALSLTFIFVFASAILSQEIIENPENPANENPGRIIRLKEVLRIKDEGRGFFFKEPWGIGVAGDGSIFVKEMDKLYKFDKRGRFVKNMVKIGQGPGEVSREIENFVINGNEIVLSCASLNKIVKIDLEGNLIKDLVVKKKRISNLLAYYKDKYFLVDFRRKSFERKEGYQDIDRNLFFLDDEGNVTETPYSFPITGFYSIRTYRGIQNPSFSYVTKLQTSMLSKKYIYLSHTQEYLIKQFDLESLRIKKSFRRDYHRVKFKSDKYRPFEFYNDVYRVLIHQSNVWVLTSTFDKEKGILIDVFNEEGKYLDSFYLPLLNSKTGDCFYQLYFPITISGNFLYAIEHDKDWNYYIAKYEILE